MTEYRGFSIHYSVGYGNFFAVRIDSIGRYKFLQTDGNLGNGAQNNVLGDITHLKQSIDHFWEQEEKQKMDISGSTLSFLLEAAGIKVQVSDYFQTQHPAEDPKIHCLARVLRLTHTLMPRQDEILISSHILFPKFGQKVGEGIWHMETRVLDNPTSLAMIDVLWLLKIHARPSEQILPSSGSPHNAITWLYPTTPVYP